MRAGRLHLLSNALTMSITVAALGAIIAGSIGVWRLRASGSGAAARAVAAGERISRPGARLPSNGWQKGAVETAWWHDNYSSATSDSSVPGRSRSSMISSRR